MNLLFVDQRGRKPYSGPMVPRTHRQPPLALILGLAVASFFTAGIGAEDGMPRAVGGVIDLRQLDLAKTGPVSLDGEWAFYWDVIASDESESDDSPPEPPRYFIDVPSYWDKLADTHPEITAQGVATYGLEILVPKQTTPFGLKFLNITPNAEIRINGSHLAEMGTVHRDRKQSRSGNRIMVIPLSGVDGSIRLTVSISNYHNINGGLNRPVQFGLYEDVRTVRERRLSLDAIFLGGVLLMGLYQFALFLLTPKRTAPLFMALLCLLAFFFSGYKHEMVLLSLFPGWDGEVRTKFIYLSLALGPFAFTSYAYSLYPGHIHRRVGTILTVLSGITALFILLTPKSIYTRILLPLEIQMGVLAAYNIVMLVRGYFRSRDKQILLYLGGLLFLLFSITFGIVDNAWSVVFQSVAGIFFIFILYQAFLQAYIYSYAFREIDFLAGQKSKLEKRNVELFSMSYIDSLTGACNRRLFDDFLASNWRVNAFSERALGMILIDIDEFKGYNEFYGHRKGDVCLTRVSELIRGEMNVMGHDTLARYGGEEFAVIISDISESAIQEVAERIRTAVESGRIEHRASSVAGVVTISLGCAILVPNMEDDPESLIDAADLALQKAKDSGRNRAELYGMFGGSAGWEPRLV